LVFCVGIPVCSGCHVNGLAFLGCAIPAVAGMITAVYGTPVAFIAGHVTDWYNNRDFRSFLQDSTLSKSISLASGATIDRLIFVKTCHYQQQFDLTVKNDNGEKLTFTITLPALPAAEIASKA
jgi:hypothetical protein